MGAANIPPVELPDGSGAFVLGLPLPPEHWLFSQPLEDRPRPLYAWELHYMPKARLREAARWAIRAATACGRESELLDPDALVQNLLLALLGPDRITERKETPPCPTK